MKISEETVAGDIANADVTIGSTPSKRTIKNVKEMSRMRFKEFSTKTKVVPSKKDKERDKEKYKNKKFEDE